MPLTTTLLFNRAPSWFEGSSEEDEVEGDAHDLPPPPVIAPQTAIRMQTPPPPAATRPVPSTPSAARPVTSTPAATRPVTSPTSTRTQTTNRPSFRMPTPNRIDPTQHNQPSCDRKWCSNYRLTQMSYIPPHHTPCCRKWVCSGAVDGKPMLK